MPNRGRNCSISCSNLRSWSWKIKTGKLNWKHHFKAVEILWHHSCFDLYNKINRIQFSGQCAFVNAQIASMYYEKKVAHKANTCVSLCHWCFYQSAIRLNHMNDKQGRFDSCETKNLITHMALKTHILYLSMNQWINEWMNEQNDWNFTTYNYQA